MTRRESKYKCSYTCSPRGPLPPPARAAAARRRFRAADRVERVVAPHVETPARHHDRRRNTLIDRVPREELEGAARLDDRRLAVRGGALDLPVGDHRRRPHTLGEDALLVQLLPGLAVEHDEDAGLAEEVDVLLVERRR